MKKRYLFFLVIPYLVCLYIMTHQLGCHVLLPLATCTDCYTYDCTGDVIYYPEYFLDHVSEKRLPEVIAHPDKPYLQGTNCNQAHRAKVDQVHPDTSLPAADGLKTNGKVYCGPSPWVIHKFGFGGHKEENNLEGSSWIQTALGDRTNQFDPFLEITFKEEPQSLFIAYDARLKPVPSWLTKDYEPVAEAYIEIYSPIPKTTIQLDVWRCLAQIKEGTTFKIPGNLYSENATPELGPADPPGSEAMYMVIIRPHKKNSLSLPPTTIAEGIKHSSGCGCVSSIDDATAKNKALEDWGSKDEYKNKGYTFENISCTIQKTCKPDTGQTCQPLSYAPHSEIHFSPPLSIADVNIPGKDKYYPKRPVEGKLQFEYKLDKLLMTTMQINDMHLKLPDIWEFSDIEVELLAPCTAVWDPSGAQPSTKVPCDRYKIKKRDFRARLRAKHDGNHVLIGATNKFEIPVTIDDQNRSFNIQGKVTGSIPVNNEDTAVEVEIDLTGEFYNFAPVASWMESKTFSECAEHANKDPIVLDAVTSFDPDDFFGAGAKPGHIVDYHWYEDYGTITQVDWGTGQNKMIPPHQLEFGVHHFTLLVRDNQGMTNRGTFEVTVADTVNPSLTVPPPVYRLLFPPEKGPAKVHLGTASATDACACSDVLVTNDAPEDLLFPPGLHKITWAADDGRGNIVTGVQDVHIWLAKEPTIADAVRLVGKFHKPFDDAAADLRAMMDRQDGTYDFASQRHLIDQLNRIAGDISGREGRTESTGRLAGLCREAAEILDQAEELIGLAAGAEGPERARLLAEASDLMADEASLMGDIREVLRQMN